jgi:putative CocE/NonD family hydrolase
LKTLPLESFPGAVGWPVPYFRKWVHEPERCGFWLRASALEHYGRVKAASLGISGWYDIFPGALFDNLNGMRKQGGFHRAIMGPWAHGVNQTRVGELDFGESAKIGLEDLQFGMLDHFLKGQQRPQLPVVRIFVMGRNVWRDEEAWPLARAVPTRFYLHSEGRAGNDGGSLNRKMPSEEPVDRFTYDPADPVPTRGGGNLVPLFGIGPMDQTEIEKRPDVLIYSSEPLPEDLEVTGEITAVLYAATSARDTDFTAKLVDVWPDGKAYNLCDGIVRARFRHGARDPSPVQPGETYCYEIDVGITSNVFLKGHRIRLEVSSSNFPRYARNLNTGGSPAQEKEPVRAEQTIYHDETHPSHLVLPVIP